MVDIDARVLEALAELWVRMQSLFGHRWTSQYGSAPEDVDLVEWSQAISGLTWRQVERGLHEVRMSRREWPPAAPEFRVLCFAIPAVLQIERELAGHEVLSAFGRLVWSLIDPWRYRNADAREARRVIEEAHALAADRVVRGEPLPAEPVANIDAPVVREFVPASEEVAAAALAKIAEVLK